MLIDDQTMCIVSILNNIGGNDTKIMSRKEYLAIKDKYQRHKNIGEKKKIKLIRMI